MQPTVTVFVAKHCGACHDYMPKFKAVAGHFRRFVNVQVVETSSPRGAAYANRMGIRGTPTTIVQTARGTSIRRVGALRTPDIARLFESAVR